MNHRRGQTLSEHGLMIALVAILAIGSITVAGASVTGLFSNVTSAVNGGAGPTGQDQGGGPVEPLPPVNVALVSVATPAVDQTVTVTGSGFAPGQTVNAYLNSDQVLIGSGIADDQGDVVIHATLPPVVDTTVAHTVTLEGRAPGNIPLVDTSASFTVTANPMSALADLAAVAGESFSGNYTLASVNLTSSFSGNSGNVTYAWSRPDGLFHSTIASPTGSFSCDSLATPVSLTVTDASGHNASTSLTIPACPPHLSGASSILTGPTYGDDYANAGYRFSAAGSGGVGPYTYTWSGPGTWSASSSPVDASLACAALDGTSAVQATIFDANRESVSVSNIVPGACPDPLSTNASASAGTVSGNYASESVSLSASATNGTGPYTYAWVYPGGSAATQNPTVSIACATSPQTATVTVTDNLLWTASANATIPACLVPLTSVIEHGTPTYDSNYGSTSIALTATATGGQTGYTYTWTGPSGATFLPSATSATPTMTVSCLDFAGGDIGLTATDVNLKTAIATTYALSACPPPVSGSISGGSPSYSGNSTSAAYHFTSTASGGVGSWTYSWSGPGNWTASSANPGTHTFACGDLSGTAQLSISDSAGKFATYSLPLDACPPVLVPAFSTNVTSGSAPVTVTFTNNSTGSPSGYDWNWADGTAHSSAANPGTHTFAAAGTYAVVLTITGPGGTANVSHIIVVDPGGLILTMPAWPGISNTGSGVNVGVWSPKAGSQTTIDYRMSNGASDGYFQAIWCTVGGFNGYTSMAPFDNYTNGTAWGTAHSSDPNHIVWTGTAKSDMTCYLDILAMSSGDTVNFAGGTVSYVSP